MSEWKETTLGNVLGTKGYIRGPFGSSLKRDEMKTIGIPVYEQKNAIYNSREFRFFIDEKKFEELKRFQVQTNDLIISCSGTVGRISIINKDDPKGIISQALLILRPDVTLIELKYLFYFLSSKQGLELITQASHGSVQLNIAERKVVETIPINLPPLAEQKAIASVLCSLDDKIDLLHRQNATLEAMAETLFRQWFVEEAKEEWEEIKIKDFEVVVTDYVANGSFASLAEYVNYKSEPDHAILIRLTDFNNNFNGDFVYVDEQAYNFLKKSKLFGGEIIISNVGAYAGTVFKCPHLERPMTLGPNSIVLKSRFNNYFYLFFKSTFGKFVLDGIISGSAQPKFNKTAFREIGLSYPSVDYVEGFEKFVKVYFDKIDLNINQIRTLTKFRDTLLPKLMSGEVRVVG